MKVFVSILLSIFMLVASTKHASAIIVLVPVVLIPIVNIVVWIIGALATPVIALSTIYFKIKKKPPFVGVLIGIGLLLLVGIIVTVIFKWVNPQRPIY